MLQTSEIITALTLAGRGQLNHLIEDVGAAFDRVSTTAQSIIIDRTGVSLPAGGHFQGIQRVPGAREVLVITSSSDHTPYYVACDMDAGGFTGRARAPQSMPAEPGQNHAGGCQMVGQCLVVGVENHDSNVGSEVQFWDFSQIPPTTPIYTISRTGDQYRSTAGAVGATSHGSGSVMAVGSFNSATIDFYTSPGDAAAASPMAYLFTWDSKTADKTGWIDNNFGAYQNLNLITQSDGKLFMVGFDQTDSTDWMDLYLLDLSLSPSAVLRKLAKKHMYCSNDCSFIYGAGIFISSPRSFDVYAVNGYSGDHDTGTTIHANFFVGL